MQEGLTRYLCLSLSIPVLLNACVIGPTGNVPVPVDRPAECRPPASTIVGTKVDVEVAKFLDMVEGGGVHFDPKVLSQATDWGKNAEQIEYTVCRAGLRGYTAAQQDWLRMFLHLRAGNPTPKEQLEWDKLHPRPGDTGSREPMTIDTIAGKYVLKEESDATSEFFRALEKSELSIAADPQKPTQGTYVYLITFLPGQVWMMDERTGERHAVRKTTTPEYLQLSGVLRLAGRTLTFEQAKSIDTDGKVSYGKWKESKDISVSVDNPRILLMRKEDGIIETWERKY